MLPRVAVVVVLLAACGDAQWKMLASPSSSESSGPSTAGSGAIVSVQHLVEWCEEGSGLQNCRDALARDDLDAALRGRVAAVVITECTREGGWACLLQAQLTTPADRELAQQACDDGFVPACWVSERAEPGSDERIRDAEGACLDRVDPQYAACLEAALALERTPELTRAYPVASLACGNDDEDCEPYFRLRTRDDRLWVCGNPQSAECQALAEEYREHGAPVGEAVEWPLVP